MNALALLKGVDHENIVSGYSPILNHDYLSVTYAPYLSHVAKYRLATLAYCRRTFEKRYKSGLTTNVFLVSFSNSSLMEISTP